MYDKSILKLVQDFSRKIGVSDPVLDTFIQLQVDAEPALPPPDVPAFWDGSLTTVAPTKITGDFDWQVCSDRSDWAHFWDDIGSWRNEIDGEWMEAPPLLEGPQ